LADKEAYTTPNELRVYIRGVKYADASGNRPSEYLRKPKPPNFSKIPANITDPAVGASQCASGSQIWNGTRGIFTANELKKASQHNFSVNESSWIVRRFKKHVVPDL